MKRILVVANDFPYPPNHGAALDMWTRLLILNRMGYRIDLAASVRVTPSEQNLAVVKKIVGDVWIVPRELGWRAAFSLLPFQVQSRRNLKDISLPQHYDAIILEAEHVASFLKNPATHGAKLILRVHNDEARYFRELSKGNLPWRKKLFYLIESIKFRVFSPSVRSACDVLWFISDFERNQHIEKNREDHSKSFFLPPDVDRDGIRSFTANGKRALFIGTLTIPHNADAVNWYITEIHPLLQDIKGYQFTVAGHTGGAPITALRQLIADHDNITLFEDSTDLNLLYENAAVFVNPVLRGAGLKLKTINALQAGLPVVTTSIGMEGTGLRNKEHLLVADTALDFAACMRQLMNHPKMSKSLVHAAQEFLTENYDMEHKLRALLLSDTISHQQITDVP